MYNLKIGQGERVHGESIVRGVPSTCCVYLGVQESTRYLSFGEENPRQCDIGTVHEKPPDLYQQTTSDMNTSPYDDSSRTKVMVLTE